MACRRIAAIALLALSACQQGVALTVSRAGNGPISLDVASLSSDFRACIDSASIYPAGQQGQPIWELGRSDQQRCLRQVRVGPAEAGFAQRSTAAVPQQGVFCAEVNGPGFGARRGFTVRAGAVTQDGDDVARC